jgi:hypothetical protein
MALRAAEKMKEAGMTLPHAEGPSPKINNLDATFETKQS